MIFHNTLQSYLMDKKKKQLILSICLIVGILIIDQIVKFWVKTTMHIGEEIPLIGDWCKLHFVENEGMAFGMAFGGAVGKYILSIFRLIASGLILWCIFSLIKHDTLPRWVVKLFSLLGGSSEEETHTETPTWLIACLSLIVAGAVGNLIDSCFYGLIFNQSYMHVATLFPPEGGYAPFLQGRVVDMFYFPIIDTIWPSWMPFVGGRPFVFFNAIFNVADAAITIAIFWLCIQYLILIPIKQKKKARSVNEG